MPTAGGCLSAADVSCYGVNRRHQTVTVQQAGSGPNRPPKLSAGGRGLTAQRGGAGLLFDSAGRHAKGKARSAPGLRVGVDRVHASGGAHPSAEGNGPADREG